MKTPSPMVPSVGVSARHVFKATLAGFLFVSCVSSPLIAQVAPAAEKSKAADDEVVKLPKFTVSTVDDKGYRAGNSVSGTRIDTPIKDLPFAINAFTQQFITDIGAHDLGEVVQYAPGVTSGARQQVNGNAAYMIRGFLQAPQTNGFATPLTNPTGGPYVDTVAIERVEVVKGPASLLYGQVAPGGTVNYITKRPEEKPFVVLSARGGSYNFWRGTIDLNQPLIPNKLLFRINAAYENGIEYFKPSKSRTAVMVPSVLWKITDRVTLKVEYQDFRRKETPYANVLPSVEVVAAAPVSGILGSAGVLQNPNDLNDFGFVGYYPLPRDFNSNSVNDYRKTHFETFSTELGVKIGEQWNARVNYTVNRAYDGFKQTGLTAINVDVPTSYTSRFPTYAEAARAFAGAILADPNVALQAPHAQLPRTQFVREAPGGTKAVQAEIIGHIDFSGIQLRPLLGAYYDDGWVYNRRRQSGANGTYVIFTPASAANRVAAPLPWDFVNQTQFPINYNTDYNPANLPLTQFTGTYTHNRAAYAMLNATMLDKRLIVIAGLRSNESDTHITNFISDPAVVNPVSPTFSPLYRETKVTPQFALGFKIQPDVLTFVSYSQSYQANSFLTGPSIPVPAKPTTSEGYEAGIKMDLQNGRISSTIAIYQIDQKDRQFSLNQLNSAGVLTSFNFQGTLDRSKGIEADLTFSPTDNWQFYGSIALNDTKTIGAHSGLEFYIGSSPQNVAKTLANFWTRYNFTSDALKGMWLGAGVNYTSEKAGNAINPSYKLPANTIGHIALGYDWKMQAKPMSAVLNWDNVTNTDYLPSIQDRGLPSRVSVTVTAKF